MNDDGVFPERKEMYIATQEIVEQVVASANQKCSGWQLGAYVCMLMHVAAALVKITSTMLKDEYTDAKRRQVSLEVFERTYDQTPHYQTIVVPSGSVAKGGVA